MSRFYTALLIILLTVSAVAGTDMKHDGNSLRLSPIPVGSSTPAVPLVDGAQIVDLASITGGQPTIVVRYLGFSCSHCVEQLTYLNSYANKLRTLGIKVLAFSSDDAPTINKMMDRMQYASDVIHVVSDPNDATARRLGLIEVDNDNERDLHGAIVVRDGLVRLSIYSEQPYMDIERLVAVASNNVALTLVGTPHALDRYLEVPFIISQIAGPSDGVNAPIDLDFNKSPLHPTDLWVVTTDSRGHGMAIIHHATEANERSIRLKKDSRASHFMWRTLGIAMGSNGAFGTAQNGENGSGDPFYQFMGPTLWSSDTAVFASRYQDDRMVLASHLDMLHQSPMGLGIAHDHDNVFWVSCGYYGDVARYDFQDPHEVGGTDHRDGIIRRYSNATLTRGQRGRPAHLALDHSSGWLYYVDPGTNSVSRLQTRTGVSDTALTAPPESGEYLAEYTDWKGASAAPYITADLGEPVGIEVVGNRLLIGDRLSGQIHLYAITETGPEKLGVIETKAQELLGICVGPDGMIWFVDRSAGTVGRITFSSESSLVAVRDVQVISQTDTVRFSYSNASFSERVLSFRTLVRTLNERGEGEWSQSGTVFQRNVAASSPTVIDVAVNIADSVNATEIMIQEVDDAVNILGLKASTFLIPRKIRRALVDDAQVETYRIGEALDLTERPGYSRLRSDLFLRAADSLTNLQTVLWNGGSFGEISVADDAIITSLLKRNIEVFLIADDPLILRTDLPNSLGFFSSFGASFRGADVNSTSSDDGQRVFNGVPGDSVSGGMGLIDCQLPRLDHNRGGQFVPNVFFTSQNNSGEAVEILSRNNGASLRSVSIRFDHPNYRSIVLGINASRFLDGVQRTTLLRNGLIWLEAAAEVEVEDTITSVNEYIVGGEVLALIPHANPIADDLVITIRGNVENVDLGLYSVTGQRLASLYQGTVAGDLSIAHPTGTLSTGTYFVIARTPTSVQHLTIMKR